MTPGATAQLLHLKLSKRIVSVLQATHMLVSQRAFEGVIKVVTIHTFSYRGEQKRHILMKLDVESERERDETKDYMNF